MIARHFEISGFSETLRAMPDDERAETIIETFRIASAEWAAMVLEHTNVPPGLPPHDIPGEDNPIRQRLKELDIEGRCLFLGTLFAQICEEFSLMIADRPKH